MGGKTRHKIARETNKQTKTAGKLEHHCGIYLMRKLFFFRFVHKHSTNREVLYDDDDDYDAINVKMQHLFTYFHMKFAN